MCASINQRECDQLLRVGIPIDTIKIVPSQKYVKSIQ